MLNFQANRERISKQAREKKKRRNSTSSSDSSIIYR